MKLGVGVLYVDIASWRIVGSEAWTLNATHLAGKNSWIQELYDARTGRVDALEDALFEIFMRLQPFDIASEAPFINDKFPQAGIALTEVVSAIRKAAIRYDIWKTVKMIDPPTVKLAVGVKGSAGGESGKALMRLAIIAIADALHFAGSVDLENLDEHSIDALAVAYSRFISLKEGTHV